MVGVQEPIGGYSHTLIIPQTEDPVKTEDPVSIDALNYDSQYFKKYGQGHSFGSAYFYLYAPYAMVFDSII